MSAPSPLTVSGSLCTFAITSQGNEIDGAIQVYSIETWNEVGKVPKARLVIFDGSASEQTFAVSSAPTFVPGAKIEILAGYDNTNKPIFSGVVAAQSLQIDAKSASKLVVDIVDPAISMTLERTNAIYEKTTDSDLIGKLITANGLSKDVSPTALVHEEIVQFYASDWDLMLMRAEMNGFVAWAEGGKVSVKPPDTSAAPVLTAGFGDAIYELEAEMNAATQFASSAIKSSAWDATTQTLMTAGPGTVNVQEAGNLSSAELAKVFAVKTYPQVTGAPIEKDSLQQWSSGEMLKSKLSKIRGQVSFQGSALAQVGKMIALAGLGTRFNGNVYVSGVQHCIREGRWTTAATFGLSPTWFAADTPNIAAPGTSGQMPAAKGLQTGVVKKVAPDPGGEYRVFVSLPLLGDDAKGVWARLASFYASNKFGAEFYPEVGDEVVIAFMNEDPRYPVILGSVYSKKLPPPLPPDEKNTKKTVLTRAKLEITFDDDKKIITIATPGKNTIVLDDTGKTIKIADMNKNSATFSSAGVAIDSAAHVTISAKGNITLDAKGNVALKAAANATLEGLQVTHTAKTKFSAQGTAQAELKSSAMVTVQGAIVKIN